MIKRIVKMTFREEDTDKFIREVFDLSKQKIRAFPGCRHMELLRDTRQSNVLFTLSYWDDEQALNNYRYSELFAATWVKTKALFSDKPQAWSLEILDTP
ncbi:MAG: putative quinol monooxygenase [Bacteroidota bacterium]